MKKYFFCLFLIITGCSSAPGGDVYGIDKPYYGASEYCLKLKAESYKDVSNIEANNDYMSQCEAYIGNSPSAKDQNEDCIINVIFGGSCSEAYEK